MTADSTMTGHGGAARAEGSTTRVHVRGRAAWVLAVAATVLPGFAAIAQPATAAPATSDAGYHIYAHGFMSNGIVGFNASDTGQPTQIPGRAPTGVPNWPARSVA
ncbi:hypothetical protein B7C42_01943 [Nocardia cerradoensis]|uniref:Uncharacterized protein n=1 Tax=Nocardia cerradoensis TaxID=85688 RepID=A0A231H9Y7_9NOCA|nr:hypothetical protein [Nocardia cerradoensis]OXR45651.1 hypothetical protein B7C42_01943 [Nocardia cerradoensis]